MRSDLPLWHIDRAWQWLLFAAWAVELLGSHIEAHSLLLLSKSARCQQQGSSVGVQRAVEKVGYTYGLSAPAAAGGCALVRLCTAVAANGRAWCLYHSQ